MGRGLGQQRTEKGSVDLRAIAGDGDDSSNGCMSVGSTTRRRTEGGGVASLVVLKFIAGALHPNRSAKTTTALCKLLFRRMQGFVLSETEFYLFRV